MKRNIIVIDEEKCNGCGQCASGCPEGAIQMVNGKAKLVSENYCDGLGACLGSCPVNAITVEQKEVAQYDEKSVMEQSIIPQGINMINAHLKHLKEHNQTDYLHMAVNTLKEKGFDMEPIRNAIHGQSGGSSCGCPGSQMKEIKNNNPSINSSLPLCSELSQWPIQLHLISPSAPYFQNADLLISADCAPFAFGNYHQKFLKGKKVITFCPKLDESREEYIEKLTELLSVNSINSVSVVRMEVPCCSGTTQIIEEAIKRSGKSLVLREYVISLDGNII
ncbi:MAG: 4Fe-4S binding protein [Candidatus Omnitrophica bacterium]|nr:4Fe-4S binding protein [Candidatus Omnitrophota bacterium]